MEVVLLPLVIVALFYFILLRPVINQQKQHRRDVSSLEVGDEVITTGGFFATVRDITPTDAGPVELSLEVAPGVVLRGTPAAVEQIVTRASDRRAEDDGDVAAPAEAEGRTR